ncbi:ATP-binding protein [Bradyrhizobium japonicum]|uniref:ATP-binding protein n=1 Tax=Bradyrhizobium japonicum TaxID=375 RepID=UPI001B8A3252|nr:ATP-binding protein [Bradyrhizobium japonicum]MBR0969609.1 ATP-binding protein [Bradyrhizobium japonicum]
MPENVRKSFAENGVVVRGVEVRSFPGETIYVVEVDPSAFEQAMRTSTQVEGTLGPGNLVVVRQAKVSSQEVASAVHSINDERVSKLIELLNERSRTSEQQPSLEYIKDAAENLRVAVTRRHHLIFGRRGVGKTALLLEVKRRVERASGAVLWINMQVLRGLDANRSFLTVVKRICELPSVLHKQRTLSPASIAKADDLARRVQSLSDLSSLPEQKVAQLIPDAQRLVALLCAEMAGDLFIFIDDLHYLEMKDQPRFLDLLHGITRDTAAWLKVAGIRNQCKTFTDHPPVGLQSGHDAAEITLDITLEEPKKARGFLSNVLQTYLSASNISNRTGVLSPAALDRLVLASGGVPRDFLTVAARSVQIARLRDNARQVGAQDVNEAAGEAGKQKRNDLEEDAAASTGQASVRLTALDRIRRFCIDERHFSFFRIGLRDKNDHTDAYRLLQSLVDLRVIHLVKSSLSEAHEVGERSEVYMVDLSEYSASRLKKDLSVIELKGDILVLRKTGKEGKRVDADTARKVVQVFRTGPEFSLGDFDDLLPALGVFA